MKIAGTVLSFLVALLALAAVAADMIGPPEDPFDGSRLSTHRLETYEPFADSSVTISQLDHSRFPTVEMYVDVLDDNGVPVSGLTADDFCVTQDGTEVPIEVVEVSATGCVTSIALVMDVSGSMCYPETNQAIDSAKTAAHRFVDNMGEFDRVAIVKFSDCAHVVQEYTSDTTALHRAIESLHCEGMTALFDGIWLATDLTSSELGSKAVIAFTDGYENSSDLCDYPPDGLWNDDEYADDSTEIVDLANGAGVPIYSIGLGEQAYADPLIAFSNGTGAYFSYAPAPSDLDSIYSDIKATLCARYLISFTSPDTVASGDTHTVTVCTNAPSCSPCDSIQYRENEPPTISPDSVTVALSEQCQPADSDLTVCAYIADNAEPLINTVQLFYRIAGVGFYRSVPMTTSGEDLYCATIPADSLPDGLGIEYYITASDGYSTVSFPDMNPQTNPFEIPLCPNDPPVIAHEPGGCVYGEAFDVVALITDSTDFLAEAKLFYRVPGAPEYDSVIFDMLSGDEYIATVPASAATEDGVEYLILARDNWGLTASFGPVQLTCADTITCWPDLSAPELVIGCAEYERPQGVPVQMIRYDLSVANWEVFPDSLFESAPDLGECGLFGEGNSRTVVEVFADDNSVLSTCEIGAAEELANLSVYVSHSALADSLWLTMYDRRCDITYYSNAVLADSATWPPTIACPFDPLSIVVPHPTVFCFDLPVQDADSVLTSADATWNNDSLCVELLQTGMTQILVTAFNDCGVESCFVSLDVVISDTVYPTPNWINVYCDDPLYHGMPMDPGDTISAFDPDGVLCGRGIVGPDSSLDFTPIYRDDEFTIIDEGAVEGDTISFEVNGNSVTTDPVIIWTANGDSFELCSYFTEKCVTLTLNEGWNLISWNVAYSDSMAGMIAPFAGCVDAVLGFDRGALSYDPDLPEYSTLQDVDYFHGYWFYMNCAATVELCGAPIPHESFIPIYPDWNLISYWPDTTYFVEYALESVIDSVEVVRGFEGNEGTVWVPEFGGFNTLTVMSPLHGYWLKATNFVPLVYPGWVLPRSIVMDVITSSEPYSEVTVSRQWMSVYGSQLTLDDLILRDGATIEFKTTEGLACGQGTYHDGLLKFTPVYGRDEIAGTTRYPMPGEVIHVYVDGERVYPNLTYGGVGQRVGLSSLSSSETAGIVPGTYRLDQNYPNPFNPATRISFSMAEPGLARLSVYNLLGQKIRSLVDRQLSDGDHVVDWDGRDDGGTAVSSGVYFYRLEAGDFDMTRKMVLLK